MTLSTMRMVVLMLSGLLLNIPISAQKKASTAKNRPNLSSAHKRSLSGPGRLHFCGEVVPTEQGNVSAKLAFAMASSSGYARRLNALKARSAPFFSVIEPILERYGIPDDFKYLPLIESAWQANAVSSAGAVGYWQFMDDTAQDMGLSIAPGHDERTNLLKSTEAACKYINFLYRKLGSWTLVAAAYNGGVGMVQRKITKVGHRDYYTMAMNPETGYYLYRILAMKQLFTNPSYGIDAVGLMLASGGNAYEQEREQARRMGWLQDQEPAVSGIPVESLSGPDALLNDQVPTGRHEVVVMDSLLSKLLKNTPSSPSAVVGDVAARLVQAGQVKVGQSWSFALTETVQIDESTLKAGDMLYAIIDDIDTYGNLFFRATKAISAQTKTTIPLTLIALNPATGLAGIPRPKVVKPGWVVQWKL
ncbi:transglycosylase SLT domain-containing protein [Spirosoma linguale]